MSTERSTMRTYYLSFATFDGFLGGCFVMAPNAELAHQKATRMGLNPGGEVMIMDLPGNDDPGNWPLPEEKHHNKRLTADYMEEHEMKPRSINDASESIENSKVRIHIKQQ